MFSSRALTGTVGQKLTPFLKNFGIQNDYLILRTLPVNCLEDESNCTELTKKDEIVSARNKIIKKVVRNNELKIIFTLGKSAKKFTEGLQKYGIPVINLNKDDIKNDILKEKFNYTFANFISPNAITRPNYLYNKNDEYIPRKDLPFMTRWWMGTSGESVSQAKEKIVTEVSNSRVYSYKIGDDNGDYYKLYAPSWSNIWKSSTLPLTPQESESLEAFKKGFRP